MDLLTIRYRTTHSGRLMVEVRVQHTDATHAINMAHLHAPVLTAYHAMKDMCTSTRRMTKNGKRRATTWKRLPLQDPVDTDIENKTVTSMDAIIMERLHAIPVASICTSSRSKVRTTTRRMTAVSMKRFVRACMPAERMPDTRILHQGGTGGRKDTPVERRLVILRREVLAAIQL
jgi:hypothetical protein